MIGLFKLAGLFALTAVAEIVGCYLPWLVLKQDRSAWLLVPAALRPENLHAIPVEDADPEAAAGRYAALLARLAGSPPEIDVVHLGLGIDGHTASLVPGDPVLGVTDADVAVTRLYRGRRRMTLTLPVLERARRIVWLVIGADKAAVLARLQAGDTTLPAGRISVAPARLYVDRDAAALLVQPAR